MFLEFLGKLETHEEPKLSCCEGAMAAALCWMKITNDTVVFHVAVKPLYIYGNASMFTLKPMVATTQH